jgi:hypothetical protein
VEYVKNIIVKSVGEIVTNGGNNIDWNKRKNSFEY